MQSLPEQPKARQVNFEECLTLPAPVLSFDAGFDPLVEKLGEPNGDKWMDQSKQTTCWFVQYGNAYFEIYDYKQPNRAVVRSGEPIEWGMKYSDAQALDAFLQYLGVEMKK